MHVHDVLNVFMCTGFTQDTHQYFMKASPCGPEITLNSSRKRPSWSALRLPWRRLRLGTFERCGSLLSTYGGGPASA